MHLIQHRSYLSLACFVVFPSLRRLCLQLSNGHLVSGTGRPRLLHDDRHARHIRDAGEERHWLQRAHAEHTLSFFFDLSSLAVKSAICFVV